MFLIGVLFASAAAVAYGLSTVLRALGARKAAVAAREHDREHQLTTEGGPSVSSTVDTFKTREFILGTSLVVIGFGAGRDYEFARFIDDAAEAGLAPDLLLSTWDLRPFTDDSDFLVALLRRDNTPHEL